MLSLGVDREREDKRKIPRVIDSTSDKPIQEPSHVTNLADMIKVPSQVSTIADSVEDLSEPHQWVEIGKVPSELAVKVANLPHKVVQNLQAMWEIKHAREKVEESGTNSTGVHTLWETTLNEITLGDWTPRGALARTPSTPSPEPASPEERPWYTLPHIYQKKSLAPKLHKSNLSELVQCKPNLPDTQVINTAPQLTAAVPPGHGTLADRLSSNVQGTPRPSEFGTRELVPKFNLPEYGSQEAAQLLEHESSGLPVSDPFMQDWPWLQSPTSRRFGLTASKQQRERNAKKEKEGRIYYRHIVRRAHAMVNSLLDLNRMARYDDEELDKKILEALSILDHHDEFPLVDSDSQMQASAESNNKATIPITHRIESKEKCVKPVGETPEAVVAKNNLTPGAAMGANEEPLEEEQPLADVNVPSLKRMTLESSLPSRHQGSSSIVVSQPDDARMNEESLPKNALVEASKVEVPRSPDCVSDVFQTVSFSQYFCSNADPDSGPRNRGLC